MKSIIFSFLFLLSVGAQAFVVVDKPVSQGLKAVLPSYQLLDAPTTVWQLKSAERISMSHDAFFSVFSNSELTGVVYVYRLLTRAEVAERIASQLAPQYLSWAQAGNLGTYLSSFVEKHDLGVYEVQTVVIGRKCRELYFVDAGTKEVLSIDICGR